MARASRSLIIGAALLFLSAPAALAVNSTHWDFRGNVPGRWDVRGLDVAQTEFGLRIHATTEGGMKRQTGWTHPVEVIVIRVAAMQDMEAKLMWHIPGDPEGDMVQLPFLIPASETPQEVTLIPSRYDQWEPDTDAIALSFPAGADVLLQGIELQGWTPMEKVVEAWKSFWTFDEFRPYSINFLWGPLLSFNDAEREELFQHLPPFGWAVNRIFYPVAILALLPLLAVICIPQYRQHRKLRVLFWNIFLGTCIALWLVFDLRMTAEIVSYAVTDLRTYVMRPPRERILRTHGSFYPVMEMVLPDLRRETSFGLVTETPSPFYALLRYYTYPSLPYVPGEEGFKNARLFFVFARPDVGIYQNQLIQRDGTVLAGTGKVILGLDQSTFLFRTDQ